MYIHYNNITYIILISTCNFNFTNLIPELCCETKYGGDELDSVSTRVEISREKLEFIPSYLSLTIQEMVPAMITHDSIVGT